MTSVVTTIMPGSLDQLLQMTTVTNDSGWWNPNSTHNGTGLPTTPPPSEETMEDYVAYQIIGFLASNYLYVLLVLGVPGNISSIFTIVSMPTVSSSKVNIANTPKYHGATTNGVVTHPSNKNFPLRKRELDWANDNEDKDLRQLLSANEKARHRHSPSSTRSHAAHPLAAHVAILAVADTWAILLKFTYNQVSLHGSKLTAPGCTIIMFLQQFLSTYANWVVVAMTIERFVAVWFPLRVGRIYTRKKALGVLGLFAALTTAVFLCHFWIWDELYEAADGYWCSIKDEYKYFINTSFYWIEAIYSSILPCCLVLTGNILIIVNIRRAGRAQRHLTNSYDQRGRSARDQRQITVMLVVVSVVFLILNLPTAIFYMVKTKLVFQSLNLPQRVAYVFCVHFFHILLDCNHAVNFYLYFLSMSTFRRRFMDTIRCKKSVRRRPTGSVYRTSQTYVQSGGPMSETSRTEMTTGRYINPHALNRNGNNADSRHSLKSCSSSVGNNARLSIHTDNSSHVTANSEV